MHFLNTLFVKRATKLFLFCEKRGGKKEKLQRLSYFYRRDFLIKIDKKNCFYLNN